MELERILPLSKGVLSQDDVVSAAQAEFFGAPISQTFLGSDIGTVKLVTIFLNCIYVINDIYNPASINDKGNAKDGFIK